MALMKPLHKVVWSIIIYAPDMQERFLFINFLNFFHTCWFASLHYIKTLPHVYLVCCSHTRIVSLYQIIIQCLHYLFCVIAIVVGRHQYWARSRTTSWQRHHDQKVGATTKEHETFVALEPLAVLIAPTPIFIIIIIKNL